MNYKLTITGTIIRLADGASIPADPRNRDYAVFLAWQAAGNTAAAADPAPAPTPTLNVDALADLLVAKGVVSKAEVDGQKK